MTNDPPDRVPCPECDGTAYALKQVGDDRVIQYVCDKCGHTTYPEDAPDDTTTEQQVAQFEEQLADLEEKELLVGILAELKWLRVALTHGSEADNTDPDMYECETCQKRVPAHDRERHAREQHNLPHGMDYEADFARVDGE